MTNEEWERRLAEAWESIEDTDEASFLALIERIVAEQPSTDGSGLFELASAQDSTGHADRAVPLYQQALEKGLAEDRRRRATIQMASSLRNLGRPEEAVSLLLAERDSVSDGLDEAVVAFLALALADQGKEREGLSLTLEILAGHLLRYKRSVINYARRLGDPNSGGVV